jgi:glycerophosphoryl diester phosphodiesterase
MALDPSRIKSWLAKHWRTLAWIAVLLVTGWLPLAKAAMFWHDFRDEVYPPARLYEASPADKLAGFIDGDGPPLILAHRGDGLFAGNNSLEAFQRALERGYDGFELDVINTADDVPVVVHNFELPTPDGKIVVPEASVEQVRAAADSLPDEQGQRFRTLDEVLERFGGRVVMVVELKAAVAGSYGVEEPTCQLIKEHGADRAVILSSLDYEVVEAVRQTPACEDIAVMYEWTGSSGAPPDDYGLPVLGVRHDLLAERKPTFPDSVQAISVYTPSSVGDLSRAMKQGAGLIQTGKPGRALRLREELVEW